MADSWHTRQEKSLIREFGGEPSKSFGADGTLDGAPVEVRVARDEDRFRVNRDTHQELVEERGSYIFDDVTDNQPPKEVSAGRVDDLLGDPDSAVDWFSDRGYEHRFVDVDEIF